MFTSRKILLTAGAVLCVVIGLLAVIYFDLRGDAVVEESMREFYKTEMYSAAGYFIDDIESGNMTLAYHHSKYAADYASQCGLKEAALMFDSISGRVLAGDMSDDMAEQVREYISTGTVPEGSIVGNIAISSGLDRRIDLPASVTVERYEAAKNSADKIFGGSNVIRRGARTQNGELLFTCNNAYALIDERTAVPIEAAISLEVGEVTMTAEECTAAAEEFLLDFFPEEMVKTATVENVAFDRHNGIYSISYTCGVKQISVTVRGDNGRVVRFIGR